MPKILLLDTYYPDFLRTLEVDPSQSYAVNLRRVLDYQFGTADFYSKYLNAFGWTAEDVITNFEPLQRLWAKEDGMAADASLDDILRAQIHVFKPEVLFFQSLAILPNDQPDLKSRYLMACQCSCAVRRDRLKNFHVLFTSFPHYLHQFKREGIKAIYNPLAFEPSVLDSIPPDVKRTYDITFVGGVGEPGRTNWNQGARMLEAVANEFPQFGWWGYGVQLLPESNSLHRHYHGPAWGHAMFRVYAQSKIVINRHAEFARGFSNNMRMYEATGCGAMLLTESSVNLHQLFTGSEVANYRSTQDALDQLYYFLAHEDERALIAKHGQQRTLNEHTYHHRMCTVSDELMELL